jgi:hypothetical protein
MRRLLTTTALIAGALCFGSAANATAITAASDILVSFSGSGGSPSTLGTAKAELGNFVFSGKTVTFDMDVTNTSVTPVDARLTALGWVTAPPTTAITDTTNVYASTTNVSLGPNSLSVCFYSGPNCNGGSNGGLENPANNGLHGDPTTTGIFSVTVTFSGFVPPLDFSGFLGKFQTANGSFDVTGTATDCVTGCVINPVIVAAPEPASIALLGLGLLGTAAVARRKRS